jgi:hypothetical protein
MQYSGSIKKMEAFFPKFAAISIVIGFIVVFAFPASIILFRHNHIERYRRFSDDRLAKVIRSAENLCRYFRLMFWLSPVYLVLVPLAIYYYAIPEWTIYYIILDLLVYVAVLEMYFYEKWILKQLKARIPAGSLAPKRPSDPTS